MALLHAGFTHVLQQQFFEKVFLQNVPRTGPSDRGIYLASHFLVCPEGQVNGVDLWEVPGTRLEPLIEFVLPV